MPIGDTIHVGGDHLCRGDAHYVRADDTEKIWRVLAKVPYDCTALPRWRVRGKIVGAATIDSDSWGRQTSSIRTFTSIGGTGMVTTAGINSAARDAGIDPLFVALENTESLAAQSARWTVEQQAFFDLLAPNAALSDDRETLEDTLRKKIASSRARGLAPDRRALGILYGLHHGGEVDEFGRFFNAAGEPYFADDPRSSLYGGAGVGIGGALLLLLGVVAAIYYIHIERA